ncbi:MAG: hypothetical protein MUC36_13435 [Planctomycetes bacterium]|jgi:hypothetical protein|nr:hypothetical protein [Planctomycetota bacterium]
MQLDDLQRIWASRGAAFGGGAPPAAPGTRRLPRPRPVRFGYVLRSSCEAALLVAGAVMLWPVLMAHRHELRYLGAGGAALVWLVGLALWLVRLAAQAAAIDFGATILVVQRQLGALRLRECHGVQWALLGGVVVWLPLPLLLLEAATGAPLLAAIDGAWLAANLLLGLVLLGLGRRWASRRLPAVGSGPVVSALVDALGDRSLRRAQQQLDELAAFAAEAPAVPPADPGSQ